MHKAEGGGVGLQYLYLIDSLFLLYAYVSLFYLCFPIFPAILSHLKH